MASISLPRGTPSPAIPWVHPAALQPIQRYFGEIGVPADSYLERNGLPGALNSASGLLPRRAVGRYLFAVAQSQGLDNLGWNAEKWLQSEELGQAYALPYEPTLYRALETAIARTMKHTSVEFGLVEGRHSVRLYRRQGFDLRKYDHEMAWFAITAFLGIVRAYAGDDWRPPRMAIPSSAASRRWLSAELPGVRIDRDERLWWIEIPRCILSLGASGSVAAGRLKPQDRSAPTAPRIDADYGEVLARILRAYLPSGRPSLEYVAGLVDTSPRTLKRRLHQCNRTYTEVLAEARFGLAKELLDIDDTRITDIAYEIGYESASNFARAFRFFTGMTPTEYRRHRRARD